jgi:large repetitive protein
MPATTVVNGTAELNSTVTLKDGAGTVLGTTVTDAQGQWQITTSDVQDSTKPLYATVVDKAGNSVTKPINFTPPVVLDLNHDGRIDYGHVVMDVTGDGVAERTTWTGAHDGVLVWDKHGDGLVHDASQYAFTQYGGSTDLQGLAVGFDTNQDGVFDAHDRQFSQFAVWRDANQNGVSDAGEVRSLADWGITSIGLTSDGQVRHSDGVIELGRTSATMADGSSMLVADAMFAHETLDSLLHNAMGTQGADASKGGAAASATAVTPSEVNAYALKPLLVTVDGHDAGRLDDAGAKSGGATASVDNPTHEAWNGTLAQLLVDQHATLHPVL